MTLRDTNVAALAWCLARGSCALVCRCSGGRRCQLLPLPQPPAPDGPPSSPPLPPCPAAAYLQEGGAARGGREAAGRAGAAGGCSAAGGGRQAWLCGSGAARGPEGGVWWGLLWLLAVPHCGLLARMHCWSGQVGMGRGDAGWNRLPRTLGPGLLVGCGHLRAPGLQLAVQRPRCRAPPSRRRAAGGARRVRRRRRRGAAGAGPAAAPQDLCKPGDHHPCPSLPAANTEPGAAQQQRAKQQQARQQQARRQAGGERRQARRPGASCQGRQGQGRQARCRAACAGGEAGCADAACMARRRRGSQECSGRRARSLAALLKGSVQCLPAARDPWRQHAAPCQLGHPRPTGRSAGKLELGSGVAGGAGRSADCCAACLPLPPARRTTTFSTSSTWRCGRAAGRAQC
jgi:hypothetical protein